MDIQHRDSRYRWVIVAAGGFMGCVAIGSIFSLPVFLQPMSAGTGWSRADISLAMTFNFIVMGLASFGWGMVLDRFGPLPSFCLVVACWASVWCSQAGLLRSKNSSSCSAFWWGRAEGQSSRR